MDHSWQDYMVAYARSIVMYQDIEGFFRIGLVNNSLILNFRVANAAQMCLVSVPGERHSSSDVFVLCVSTNLCCLYPKIENWSSAPTHLPSSLPETEEIDRADG